MSVAMKNWSCRVTEAICSGPWFKRSVTLLHLLYPFFSPLLFSLFLHRKGNLVEKIILSVCLCLDVWDDSFWKNLISKFFWETNVFLSISSIDSCSLLTFHQPKWYVAMVSKYLFPWSFLALAYGSWQTDMIR